MEGRERPQGAPLQGWRGGNMGDQRGGHAEGAPVPDDAAGALCLPAFFGEPEVQAEGGEHAYEDGKEVVGGVGGEECEGQPCAHADNRDEDGERCPYVGRAFALVDQDMDEVDGGDGDTHEGVAEAEVGLEDGAAEPVAEEKDCESPDEA